MPPPTYYEYKAREQNPDKLQDQSKRERKLEKEIQRVWEANLRVYGARKLWRQLNREGMDVARCTVERLMQKLGIRGITRGAKCWTTQTDESLLHPADLVSRQFVARRPNQLWVADITYGMTWKGFVYDAFVTDVFSRPIVGRQVTARSLLTWCWRRWGEHCGRVGRRKG